MKRRKNMRVLRRLEESDAEDEYPTPARRRGSRGSRGGRGASFPPSRRRGFRPEPASARLAADDPYIFERIIKDLEYDSRDIVDEFVRLMRPSVRDIGGLERNENIQTSTDAIATMLGYHANTIQTWRRGSRKTAQGEREAPAPAPVLAFMKLMLLRERNPEELYRIIFENVDGTEGAKHPVDLLVSLLTMPID